MKNGNMKNDYFSRHWVTECINSGGLFSYIISAGTFDEETGGVDIIFWDFWGEMHNAELKVQNKSVEDLWTSDFTGVSFYNVPQRTDSHDTFNNLLTGSNAYDSVKPAEIPEKFKGKKFFIVNADSNRDGSFMFENEEEKYNCKWLKILKGKQDLILIYKDGVLHIPYQTIRKNCLGYIRYYDRNTQSRNAYYSSGDRRKRWGIKAAIEINNVGMTWIPLNDIPDNVYGNNI